MAKTQQRLPRADAPVLLPELIMEILSWVPIKSLMRFRENSKKCLTTCTIRGLFENPSFTIDDDCHQIDDNYVFKGACNGLVCLMELDRPEDQEFWHWFRFWNPATRIMSEYSPHFSAPVPFSWDWDYNRNFVKYGFGYDKWSNTYKVVIFLLDAKSENWVVQVHCLGDTCWRYILTCPAFPVLGESDGQFACGSVNWLVIQKSGYDYQWETDTVGQLAILSFDLNKETYKYFLMPDGLSEVSFDDLRLGVLKGCLCLSQDDGGAHFAIWLMREFGVEKSWTQLLNVPYDIPGVLSPRPRFNPVCISENDDALLLADSFYDKFLLWNLRDNRIERTVDFNSQVPRSCHDYVHGLVLPYQN